MVVVISLIFVIQVCDITKCRISSKIKKYICFNIVIHVFCGSTALGTLLSCWTEMCWTCVLNVTMMYK